MEKFKNLISKNGEIENVSVWGRRKLAYPINYIVEGFYVLIDFSSRPDFSLELQRVYKITSGVIRSLVIKKEIHKKKFKKSKISMKIQSDEMELETQQTEPKEELPV